MWLLVVATLAVLGVPVIAMGVDSIGTANTGGAGGGWSLPWDSLARSVGWAVLIGVVAAGLGIPIAWTCRRTRSGWAVLLLTPAMFPSFLAYSGWGMLRAPLTVTGDFIGSLRDSGWEWLPGVIDRTLAIGGLSLWAAPLAAIAMLPGVRAISDDTLHASRLECAGFPRVVFLLRALIGPILFAVLVVAAIMLGSAVPLHLARVQTASILLWAQLDLTPPAQHWRVWVAAWPIVVAAALLARATGTLGTSSDPAPTTTPDPRRTPWWVALAAVLVVGIGTLAPMALYAANLRSLSALFRYCRDHAPAVTTSILLATCSAGLAVALTLAAWHAAGNGRSVLVRRLATVWTFAGLLPGVMIGSAVARGFAMLDSMGLDSLGLGAGDSFLPILVGHAARFGFLPLWVGIWLAASEPRESRDQRLIDGADTVPAWFRASVLASPGALAGVAAAVFVLSLHEIEAAVLTLWPGGQLLARVILSDLHFFRTQELAAGIVVLAGLFVPPALAAAWFYGRTTRR